MSQAPNLRAALRVAPRARVDLSKIDPGNTHGIERGRGKAILDGMLERLTALQERLWAEHERSVLPPQSVPVEPELADRGRRRCERIEGAAVVVHEAGLERLRGPDGAADLRLRLQHVHGPTRVGEAVGGDEPVRARADYDGVRHGLVIRSRVGNTSRESRAAPAER